MNWLILLGMDHLRICVSSFMKSIHFFRILRDNGVSQPSFSSQSSCINTFRWTMRGDRNLSELKIWAISDRMILLISLLTKRSRWLADKKKWVWLCWPVEFQDFGTTIWIITMMSLNNFRMIDLVQAWIITCPFCEWEVAPFCRDQWVDNQWVVEFWGHLHHQKYHQRIFHEW